MVRYAVETVQEQDSPHELLSGPCLLDGAAASLLAAFDHVPNVYIFVKDTRRVFIACTTPFVELMGCVSKEQILGKSDEYFSPTYLVEHYRDDDERVLRDGAELVDVVELVGRRDGGYDWFASTKTPVLDGLGRTTGIIGVTRRITSRDSAAERFLSLAPAVEYICRDYMHPIKVKEIAAQVQMSASHFNRLFVQHFAVTPYKYLMRVRIAAACDLLATTDLPVGIISNRTGFYDTSHLTNEFKREQGVSPSDYRVRVQARPNGNGTGLMRNGVPLTYAASKREDM